MQNIQVKDGEKVIDIRLSPSTPFLGVTRDGRVMNINTQKWLTARDNGHGYMKIHTSIHKKQCARYVHRLVAECYISNPNGLAEVNHLDGNKNNNCVDNLEWCTSSENKKHAYKIGLKVVSEVQRQAARNSINQWRRKHPELATALCRENLENMIAMTKEKAKAISDEERKAKRLESNRRYRESHIEEIRDRDRKRHKAYYAKKRDAICRKARERYADIKKRKEPT